MNELKTVTILFRAKNALEREIKKNIISHQLSVSEFGTLEALYHKGPLPVGDIVSKVLIANSSMSYVLQQLTARGLIIQKQSHPDKRKYIVELTKEGSELIACVYKSHATHMRELLNVLTPNEEETLQALLKKLGKHPSLQEK